jgi:uncharacterized protein (TIGR03086 family)
MDLLSAHGKALQEFDRRVQVIADDQWDNPTPDTDWTVRDLLEHLVGEQLWVPPLLRGATIEEVGNRFDGDNLGDDPKAAWSSAAAAARQAWLEPGATGRTVHLSFGDTSATEYGWQMTMDLAVHAWDLARGIGADDTLPPDLSEAVLGMVRPEIHRWAGSGLFAPPVSVSADADVQTQLLALLGRQR